MPPLLDEALVDVPLVSLGMSETHSPPLPSAFGDQRSIVTPHSGSGYAQSFPRHTPCAARAHCASSSHVNDESEGHPKAPIVTVTPSAAKVALRIAPRS